jgi:hypothetical protein
MFAAPLPSTGHGADRIENTSSVVRIVVLQHGPQRTQLPLFRVRWNVCTESLPSNGYMRHNTAYIFSIEDCGRTSSETSVPVLKTQRRS